MLMLTNVKSLTAKQKMTHTRVAFLLDLSSVSFCFWTEFNLHHTGNLVSQEVQVKAVSHTV